MIVFTHNLDTNNIKSIWFILHLFVCVCVDMQYYDLELLYYTISIFGWTKYKYLRCTCKIK
jgi:hypothetical protein